MSWLDLPPDPNQQPLTLSSAETNPDSGLAPVLLSLVGGGLVGVATSYGLEVWQVEDPARLASTLGVGIVERVETNQGWAETGHLDPTTGMLQLRHRNPQEGLPRRVQLRQGTMPNQMLDLWGGWQIDRISDAAYRRGDRWALRQIGYGRSEFELGMLTQESPQGRQVVATAVPERIGRVWKGKAPVVPIASQSGSIGESYAVMVPATRDGIRLAAGLFVDVMKREEIRPWEVMPCFPNR